MCLCVCLDRLSHPVFVFGQTVTCVCVWAEHSLLYRALLQKRPRILPMCTRARVSCHVFVCVSCFCVCVMCLCVCHVFVCVFGQTFTSSNLEAKIGGQNVGGDKREHRNGEGAHNGEGEERKVVKVIYIKLHIAALRQYHSRVLALIDGIHFKTDL